MLCVCGVVLNTVVRKNLAQQEQALWAHSTNFQSPNSSNKAGYAHKVSFQLVEFSKFYRVNVVLFFDSQSAYILCTCLCPHHERQPWEASPPR